MRVAEACFFEVGILLEPGDKEFESYNMVYNPKGGYFNQNGGVIKKEEKELEELKSYIEEYVKKGDEHTYGIIEDIGEIEYEDNEEDYGENGGGEMCSVYDIQGTFKTQNVIYSLAKINDKIAKNFLK